MVILLTHEEMIILAKNSVVDWWNDSKEYVDLWGNINNDSIDIIFESSDHMENCNIIALKVFSIIFMFKYYNRVNRAYLDVYDVVSRSLIVLD